MARKINDLVLLSFPKSGRTWVRVIIGRYISLKYNLPESQILDLGHQYGLTFTHAGFTWGGGDIKAKVVATKDIILLTRNPYDTLVSAYFDCTYRGRKNTGNISKFLRGKYGVSLLNEFNKYTQTIQPVAKITYEELHAQTRKQIKKILVLMGEEIDYNILNEAIDYSKFENMRKLEDIKTINLSKNIPKQNARKVREGKIKNFETYLSKEDIQYIDETLSNQIT